MKTKMILMLAILPLALTSCANSQGDVFGRKADAGAIIGGMAGTVIGAYNGNPLKGALIGAGVGLGAGAIADANDARQAIPSPSIPQPTPPPQVVMREEIPMVVMETPIIIEERVWAGNDLWIISYHGIRGANGRVRYVNHVPFHRRFIRGPHGR